MSSTNASAPRTWHHEQDGFTKADVRPRTVETLIRQGRAAFDAAGEPISQSRLSRLIRAFLATGQAQQEFGAWVTTYADPVGEQAVWNVLKGGGVQ